MRHPWPHRDGDAEDATPDRHVPSEGSADRLADRLHREIEDLRDGLADDLLLTLLLLGEDEVEEAVDLLDEGSDRLTRFQDRVEHAVADAAVEREAEAVLASAAGDEAPTGARTRAVRIRALASVAAAVLAAVVALASVAPSDGPSLVTAGATSPAPGDGPLRSVAGAPAGGAIDEQAARGLASERASSSPSSPGDRLEVLLAVGDHDEVVARLGREPRRSVVATLFGVDRIVRNIVEDAGSTADAVVADVSGTLPEVEVPDVQPTRPAVDRSSEEPAEEPEPTEEPAEEPTGEPSPAAEGDDGTHGEDADDPGAPPSADDEASGDGGSDTEQVPGSGFFGEGSEIL